LGRSAASLEGKAAAHEHVPALARAANNSREMAEALERCHYPQYEVQSCPLKIKHRTYEIETVCPHAHARPCGRIFANRPFRSGATVVTVLVADDHFDSAETTALALELDGFKTIPVMTGQAAIAAIDKFRPNGAVLDLKLGDFDGFTLPRYFREFPDPIVKHATLVAYTGLQTNQHRIRAAHCGFDYYLIKPSTASEIAVCLNLAESNDPREFTVTKIDLARMASLSERSKRAVAHATAIRIKFAHLFRYLKD
jgi:CheY-like chemotaxis protein